MLNLEGTRIDDIGLMELRKLRELHILVAGDCHIKKLGFLSSPAFAELMQLGLSGNEFEEKELENLMGLEKLYSLDLSRTKVTAAALQRLSRLKSLRELTIYDTAITAEDVVKAKIKCIDVFR